MVRVSRCVQRSSKYSNVRDTKQENVQTRGGTHGNFYSTFNPQEADSISLAVLVEHYQPYEFPICPVLNSDTQRLVRDSWSKIISMDFENTEFGTGKVSGASYFYNHFFTQLFARLADFSRIFPDVSTNTMVATEVNEWHLVRMLIWCECLLRDIVLSRSNLVLISSVK